MDSVENIKEKIFNDGFAIINTVFTNAEIENLLFLISQTDNSRPTFRKTNDLFAIRQFLKEVPELLGKIFNDNLNSIISETFGKDYFIVKSIYFDKPENSNWFVSYHQDLTISVDKKLDIDGFRLWTKKQNQYAVQPPLELLQNNFTIRIHLDDTNKENGALKVIPKSHLKGIYRSQNIDWSMKPETICDVKKGGIMFMKPLLMHASGRTTNRNKRRVIHIEFSKMQLPHNLKWSEYIAIKY